MVYYALSPNKNLGSNITKVKKLTHAECGSALTRLDDGQCACVICQKVGWPVKRQ